MSVVSVRPAFPEDNLDEVIDPARFRSARPIGWSRSITSILALAWLM
jgi:hypothetical protein